LLNCFDELKSTITKITDKYSNSNLSSKDLYKVDESKGTFEAALYFLNENKKSNLFKLFLSLDQ